MSTERKETEIIYRLIDEVSQDIKKLQESIDQTNASAENSQTGFNSMTGSVLKANLATQALMATFNLLRAGFNEGVEVLKAGARLDMMNESLEVVADNMGYTTQQIQEYRNSLEEANTYGSKQTEVLKTLMQTGLIPLVENLRFANGEEGFPGLILTIKDFAASAQVTSGQALKDFSTAIQRLEPLLLEKYFTMRNLNFVYQDFAGQLGKTAIELTENEKRQAFLNEIVREGAIQMGVYGETYDTAGKNLLSLTDVADNLKEELGLQLQPAFKIVTNSLLSMLKGVRDYIKENPDFVRNVLAVTAAAGTFIATIVVVPKVIAAARAAVALLGTGLMILRGQATAAQLSVGLLGVALVALGALATAAFAKQVQAQEGAGDATRDLNNNLKEMFGNAQDGSAALNEGLSENAQKLQSLADQIERENENFNKQLAQLVDARRESIEENKKLLEEEKKAFEDAQKERDKKYKDSTDKISDENEQRLKDLEDTLGQELQAGSSNYEDRLRAYQAAMDAERVAGEQRLIEAKAEYEEETAKAQEEYTTRTSALQTKITQDEELLTKHAELVKGINRDVLRDEIEELQFNHQRRLEELKLQLEKEKAEYDKHNSAIGGSFSDLIDGMNTESVDWGQLLKPIDLGKLLEDMVLEIARFYDSVVGGLWNVIVDVAGGIAKGIAQIFNDSPILSQIATFDIAGIERDIQGLKAKQGDVLKALQMPEANLDRLYGKARGTKYWKGGSVLVGEEGAEIVDLPQGSRISNTNESQERMNSRKGTIIINNNYPEGLPAEIVVSRQMFQLKTLTA